jgi:hypothetical protein
MGLVTVGEKSGVQTSYTNRTGTHTSIRLAFFFNPASKLYHYLGTNTLSTREASHSIHPT